MSEPAIARLIGEGVERPEASLPLDINYAKLTEWLVTRQKIPKDWHKRLQVIQAKAAEAVKELPPGTLSSLAEGADAPVDYLRAVEIRDKLASTAERTMFGGLQGPAATWDKIVKAYEKQYVYLGEAAQSLVQNVDFEIPYLRRQSAKLSGQVLDCERKHAEYLRNAATCAAKYKEECKKLGVSGASVRTELRALAGELPAMLRGVVDSLHDPRLQAAAEYYSAFARFAHAPRAGAPSSAKCPASTSAAPQSLEPSDMLPTLFEVRARRTAPPAAPAPPEASSSAAAGGIDWGDMGAGAGDAAAGGAQLDIEWDLGVAATTTDGGGGAAVDINWDFDMADVAPAAAEGDGGGDAGGGGGGGGAAAAGPAGIDWDIEVDAVGDTAADADANNRAGGADAAAAADASTSDGAAAGSAGAVGGSSDPDDVAAARLERDGDYRSRLLDDLTELRAFLAQRKADLGGSGSELLATALPEAVSSVDGAAVASMLAAVQQCLAQLSTPRFRQLLLIATSQRYLDRLEASLQRQAGAEAKLQRAAADVTARKQEARGGLVGLTPRIGAMVERSRRLKALCERGIAAALGGKRTINVLGEVNAVLAAAH